MKHNEKIANINTDLKGLFFSWLEITRPFHKLPNQPQKIVALLLYYNYIYSKDVKKKNLVWKLVFDIDTRILIKEELNIKDCVFQNTLSYLRKKKIIVNNKIISTYVPYLSQDIKNFKILFNFNIVK